MLSNRTIWPLLADGFVGVRMDWEQGNHFRDKFGFVLGPGDQLLLQPDATPIPPAGGKKVYGRHGEDITAEVLSRVRRTAGTNGLIEELRLDWFLWPRKPSAKRRGGFYPPPVDAVAQYARLPIVEIDRRLQQRFSIRLFSRGISASLSGNRVTLRANPRSGSGASATASRKVWLRS